MGNYGLVGDAVQAARLNPAARTVVYGAYFQSLFKGIRTNEALAVMGALLGDFTPKYAKLNAFTREAGHLLSVVKPAMFAVFATQIRPAQCRKNGWDQFRYPLTKEDLRVIDEALLYAPLRSTLRAHLTGGLFVRDLAGIDRLVTSVILDAEIKSYIRKFVHRKMEFFTHGSQARIAEICQELQLSAVYALRRAYPVWSSRGHMLAIAKTAIHNSGQNMIDAHASQKRCTLTRNPDGSYSSLNVAIDASAAVLSMAHASSTMVATLDGSSADGAKDVHALDSLRSLLHGRASVKFTSKQLRYLRLVSGEHDDAFSDHLGVPNDSFADDASFAMYNRRVCEWLRVPEAAAAKLLKDIAHLVG